jgi:trk system potassium uptake protein TrkA
MKVVIVGAGKLGVYIARKLIEEKREVIIIEKETESANAVGNELDCMVINDDASRPEVLRKVGIAKADWFLALTGSDEVNILCCGLVASESANIRTVARVETPFYASLSEVQRKTFGLDVLIDPARETADSIVHIIAEGFAGDVIPLHDGRLQLRTLSNLTGTDFVGHSLSELRRQYPQRFLIAAVNRKGHLIIPDGNFFLEDGDGLYLLGTPDDLDQVIGAVAEIHQTVKRILIIGATNMAERLIQVLSARELTKSFTAFVRRVFQGKRTLTVMDANRDRLKQLTRLHPEVEFMQGDCTQEDLLETINVAKYDLVICATDSQTRNILVAQLLKNLGVKKSIAIATNDRFKALGSQLELDAIINVKSVVAAAVLELVRHARIRTIYEFFEDNIEIVELPLSAESPVAGKALRELALPKGALVAFIITGTEVTIPDGNTVLMAGDSVAFIVSNSAIASLERIFGSAQLRSKGFRNGG